MRGAASWKCASEEGDEHDEQCYADDVRNRVDDQVEGWERFEEGTFRMESDVDEVADDHGNNDTEDRAPEAKRDGFDSEAHEDFAG